MTPKQVLVYFNGNKNKVARELGVTTATVYNWLKSGVIAPHRQALIERDTNGKLKADS